MGSILFGLFRVSLNLQEIVKVVSTFNPLKDIFDPGYFSHVEMTNGNKILFLIEA